MRDIPDDVREDAEAALMQANIKAHMLGEPTDPVECIALAILAERDQWTDGSCVQVPVSRKQAELMILMGEGYLGTVDA